MSLTSDDATIPPAFLHPFARPAAGRDAFIDIVSASGAEVVDSGGRRYIDALASLWYCNVGHGRTEIAEAVAGQMRRLDAFHTFDRFTNPMADALAERLAGLAPDARRPGLSHLGRLGGGRDGGQAGPSRPGPGRSRGADRHREPAPLVSRRHLRGDVRHWSARQPGGFRSARARRRAGAL